MSRKSLYVITTTVALALGAGPAFAQEIDCTNAEENIQRLKHEKLNTLERMEKGVTSILPIGLVVNTVKGTEGKNMEMATGEYNENIDKSIAAIKEKCGLK